MQPLLSICVPTYNRAIYLEKSLDSIVSQDRFILSNDVEIIINDNFSNDSTESLCNLYVEKYFPKIKYFKNPENIEDRNFEIALSHGSGLFLKLSNDTLIYESESLNFICNIITQNIGVKPVIFLSNGKLKNINYKLCVGLEQFVESVSFWSTWIACFGIWKEDFHEMSNFSRAAELKLIQTDVLLRLVNKKKNVIINNNKFFSVQEVSKKGGYNLFEIFCKNYLSLYKSYLATGDLRRITYQVEKYKLFRNFILMWYEIIILTKNNEFTFEKERAFFVIFQQYKYDLYFYFGISFLHFRKILRKISYRNIFVIN